MNLWVAMDMNGWMAVFASEPKRILDDPRWWNTHETIKAAIVEGNMLRSCIRQLVYHQHGRIPNPGECLEIKVEDEA